MKFKNNKKPNPKTSMKMRFSICVLLIASMCLASNMYANEYVMLSPLDTSALPTISHRNCGGELVRSALNGKNMWKNSLKNLQRANYADKAVYKMMLKLYRYTHPHFVEFPVAYWSEDAQGDSLLVSGRVYLPKRRTLKGIVVANHYTICSDIEAPSNMFSMESMFTMKGYAVIMADYVGYGLSREEVHPYLHWRSAARTSVDLLDCMPQLLDYYGYTYSTDVVVIGYSQGGAVALGVARMIEELGEVTMDQEGKMNWTVRKLYAGAGPYDPAATYDYCVAKDTMGIPAAIPMIVMGLSDAYGLGFTLDEFFQEPLLSHYDEWVQSKEYTVRQINEMMGSTCMSILMQPKSLDKNSPLAHELYNVLEMNSNVKYDLQSPAYFLHSVHDEVVPIVNSKNLKSEMPDTSKVVFDFGEYGTHMEASIPFMQYVYRDL